MKCPECGDKEMIFVTNMYQFFPDETVRLKHTCIKCTNSVMIEYKPTGKIMRMYQPMGPLQ